MTEKDINPALLSAGGYLPDHLCSRVERPNKSNQELIVFGAIGNTARQNRDNMRIFGGQGLCPTLKSHISKESIMVVKRWEE